MATHRRDRSAAAADPHTALATRILSAAGELPAGLASEGPLPSRQHVRTLIEELLEVLFPESHRNGTDGGNLRDHVATTIGLLAEHLEAAIYLGLHRLCRGKKSPADRCRKRARGITQRLLAALPEVRAELAKDVLAAFDVRPRSVTIHRRRTFT